MPLASGLSTMAGAISGSGKSSIKRDTRLLLERPRPAAVAGYPNITLPMGNIFGLPVGISFFGQAWSEPTLIKLAFAFEQATRFRQTPNLLATANLDSANEVVSE